MLDGLVRGHDPQHLPYAFRWTFHASAAEHRGVCAIVEDSAIVRIAPVEGLVTTQQAHSRAAAEQRDRIGDAGNA